MVYEKVLLQLPEYPPEIGGIFGERQGVIDLYWVDRGINNKGRKCCSYEPNTQMLNKMIERWNEKGIAFAGIFHTHFWGNKSLSEGDIQYIRKIMIHMPETIEKLYFPIITMPEKEMFAYVAIKDNEIIIKQDVCEFMEDEL